MKKFETTIGGRVLIVEFGEVAKQAAGAVLVKYGDSAVLSTVCYKQSEEIRDFFPLMVIYQEKLYAGGKIPGGFLKREGRPTDKETLTSRLIDRPIRPLFPEGYQDDVQIVNTVISSDPEASTEMAALIGSSLALMVSPVPFEGPVAGVNVGYINGKYVLNPNFDTLENNKIELTVAGTKDAINMVESGAKEVQEDEMLKAILFAHEEIKKIIAFQEKVVKELKPEKITPKLILPPKDLFNDFLKKYGDKIKKALLTFEKKQREAALDLLKDEIVSGYLLPKKELKITEPDNYKYHEFLINKIYEDLIALIFRRLVTIDKIRPDSRKVDEIRPLSARIDIVKRPHGTALFTRGQTQSLGVVTLGPLSESQIIDDLSEEERVRFLLHYNFPPFSVGETGRYGAPGRREIGHGNLARRAILPVLPDEEKFPYTIRVVSEILESNGSSSMATVCSATLSLMAAGVPISEPVAGIAMGLIKEEKNYTILTDIQGLEDHHGDMDFKVAGSKNGITALQMDIKIKGINEQILKEALQRAKDARFKILEVITDTIKKPKDTVSEFAPKVKLIKINPEKIKGIIGSGGKVINKIIEDNDNVKIDIEQDGRVYIMHEKNDVVLKTCKIIEDIAREAEVGKIYEGIVKRIEAYGAFVELWPGAEGLLHISKIANERVNKVEDFLKLGDQVLVKCIDIDNQGRIDLSRKDVLSQGNKKEKEAKQTQKPKNKK